MEFLSVLMAFSSMVLCRVQWFLKRNFWFFRNINLFYIRALSGCLQFIERVFRQSVIWEFVVGFWIGWEGGVGICLGNVVRSFDF